MFACPSDRVDGIALFVHGGQLQRVGPKALDQLVAHVVRVDHGFHCHRICRRLEHVDVLRVLFALLRHKGCAFGFRQRLDVVVMDGIHGGFRADLTVMRLLLKYGADPKIATFGGTTALMAAAGVNWVVDQTYDEGPKALLEAVKLCYELGLSVNDVNSMGITAVMGAANRGSDDILEWLVEKGARLDVKDKEGRTPLNWAEGVFLATHPAKPKPSSMALIQKLMAKQ